MPANKQTRLFLDVAYWPDGDWQLTVKANGQTLHDSIIGPNTNRNRWAVIDVDLSKFAGSKVNLELLNQANGWNREHAYWGRIAIVTVPCVDRGAVNGPVETNASKPLNVARPAEPAPSKKASGTVHPNAPIADRADYDAIATGKWIPVLERDMDLQDQIVFIPGKTAVDAIIRARVKKLNGQNLSISLRRDEENPRKSGCGAWFNGGNWFGVFMGGNGYNDHGQWHTPRRFDDAFELAFSAVGETLTVYVNGKRIGEARDTDYRRGGLSIGALRGRSLFQDVEIMILDK